MTTTTTITSTTTTTTTHHYFLMRHCIRSVQNKSIRKHVVGNIAEPLDDPKADWVQERILPQWNVPSMDCTEAGLEHAKEVGRWMVQNLILKNSHENYYQNKHTSIQWEILADASSHRDVDTAYQVSRGIQRALEKYVHRDDYYYIKNQNSAAAASVTTTSFSSQGVQSFTTTGERTIHWDEFRHAFLHESCKLSPRTKTQSKKVDQREIDARIVSIPRPSLTFRQGMELVQDILGIPPANNTESSSYWHLQRRRWFGNGHNDNYHGSYNAKDRRIEGPAKLLYDMTSMLFYARLSGIAPYSASRKYITTGEMYDLIQFAHWYKGIKDGYITYAAHKGSIQAQSLLQTLRHGYYQFPATSGLSGTTHLNPANHDQGSAAPKQQQDEEIIKVTIVLGHDGDLGQLATTLGAHWILQPPYHSGEGAFLPAPPMSAIHAVRRQQEHHDASTSSDSTKDSDRLELSFVYPLFADVDSMQGSNLTEFLSKPFIPDLSGRLERTPLVFPNPYHSDNIRIQVSPDGTSTILELQPKSKTNNTQDESSDQDGNGPLTIVDWLQQHVKATLEPYGSDTKRCFRSVGNFFSSRAAIAAAAEAARQQQLNAAEVSSLKSFVYSAMNQTQPSSMDILDAAVSSRSSSTEQLSPSSLLRSSNGAMGNIKADAPMNVWSMQVGDENNNIMIQNQAHFVLSIHTALVIFGLGLCLGWVVARLRQVRSGQTSAKQTPHGGHRSRREHAPQCLGIGSGILSQSIGRHESFCSLSHLLTIGSDRIRTDIASGSVGIASSSCSRRFWFGKNRKFHSFPSENRPSTETTSSTSSTWSSSTSNMDDGGYSSAPPAL